MASQGSGEQFRKRSFNFKIVCMQFQYEKPHARASQSVSESGSESVGHGMSPPDSGLRSPVSVLRIPVSGTHTIDYGQRLRTTECSGAERKTRAACKYAEMIIFLLHCGSGFGEAAAATAACRIFWRRGPGLSQLGRVGSAPLI